MAEPGRERHAHDGIRPVRHEAGRGPTSVAFIYGASTRARDGGLFSPYEMSDASGSQSLAYSVDRTSWRGQRVGERDGDGGEGHRHRHRERCRRATQDRSIRRRRTSPSSRSRSWSRTCRSPSPVRGPRMMNITEGMSAMVTVMANPAVDADTEVMLMRDRRPAPPTHG